MTQRRARKLLGRPLTLGQHAVRWSHSRHDQLQPGIPQYPVEGRLLVVDIQRNGFRTQRLFCSPPWLGTDPLPSPRTGRTLCCALAHRNEFALSQDPNAHGADGVQILRDGEKEWVAGLMAYNLVRAAMLCAALHAGVSAISFSFNSSRRHLQNWLAHWSRSLTQSPRHWETLLALIAALACPNAANHVLLNLVHNGTCGNPSLL